MGEEGEVLRWRERYWGEAAYIFGLVWVRRVFSKLGSKGRNDGLWLNDGIYTLQKKNTKRPGHSSRTRKRRSGWLVVRVTVCAGRSRFQS